MIALGLDTSNYTTSAALYDSDTGVLVQKKQLLPVKEGELGLRQSDAVFHHTRQLPDIVEALFAEVNEQGLPAAFTAVGASTRPCETEGSYMPCFLVGNGLARNLAAANGLPRFEFSHQQGHVAAAAFGAGRLDLLDKPFLAFHVSGGTTEVLRVEPEKDGLPHCKKIGGSLDLKAGQLIDRVGGMLGLPFPAGPALERLALSAPELKKAERPHVKAEPDGCHLSGIENQCKKLLADGKEPAFVARYCLCAVYLAVKGLTEAALQQTGDLPVVYAGGVMSNSILKEKLQSEFGGIFAPPEYSSDNACGVAVLTARAAQNL